MLVYQVTRLLRSPPDEIVPERQTSHYRDGLSLKQADSASEAGAQASVVSQKFA